MALNALSKSKDEVIYLEKEEFKIMFFGAENQDFKFSFIDPYDHLEYWLHKSRD